MNIIQSVGHITGDSGFRTLSDESPTLTGAERMLGFVAAQTAARTAALPASAGFAPDTTIQFVDLVGGVTSTNTFTITVAAGDKINGVTNGTVVMNAANQTATLRTDGAGNWLASISTANASGSASGPGSAAKTTTNATVGATTAAAGDLTGANFVNAIYTGVTNGGAAALTTRTAAQMIADAGLVVGQTYEVLLVNGNAGGIMTLTGGVGVTISGTATLAASTGRFYTAKVLTATTMSFTNNGATVSFS